MDLDTALQLLAESPAAPLDVAHLALLLARDEYPGLDVEAYLSELGSFAREAQGYVRGDFAARVAGLQRYLFHELGFRGNQQDYYDPRNSYLNDVLDRRTGIPITLSVVAMAVGARTGLQVVGVGLPGHFVAKAIEAEQEVLFDPFHGGRRLTVTDCEHLVLQVTGQSFEATPAALQPVPPGALLTRMLGNLKALYVRQEDHVRSVRVIQRLRQLHPDDPFLQRDLGISLLHAGQPGQAIKHLSGYVSAEADSTDLPAVQRLLEQAHAEVAKWN